MSKQLKADMMLLLVTLSWGASYYAIDVSLEDMGPISLNAFRFVLAFALVAIFSFKKVLKINGQTLKYSFFAGIMLALSYSMATYSVIYTSMSNAAFLASMTVVFTPILAFVFKGQRPSRKFKFVVVMCVIGMGLLTLNEGLKPALGDIFSLLCALSFATNLLLVESALSKPDVDAYLLGVFMLGVVGLLMTILAFIFEQPHLPTTGRYWGYALFLSLFCTGMAIIAQSLAQQHTSASHVGLIYTMEPIFAAMVAYIMAGEVLSPRGYLGATLMVGSIFLMEIDFSQKIRRSQRRLQE